MALAVAAGMGTWAMSSISSALYWTARARSPSIVAISQKIMKASREVLPVTSRTWLDRASASGHASSKRPSIARSIARTPSCEPGGRQSASSSIMRIASSAGRGPMISDHSSSVADRE